MVDLFPEKIIARLKAKFPGDFEALNHVERVALALAACEGTVNHSRLRSVTTEHPVDLSKTLQHLTHKGMLESTGGRRAIYHLTGEEIATPEDVFGPPAPISAISSPNLGSSSPNLTSNPPNLGPLRNPEGCLLSAQLTRPMIDDLATLSPGLRMELDTIAAEPRIKNKLKREILTGVILQLCTGRFVMLRCLAELVNRQPETLRDQYLGKLVRERKLALAFPTKPTHEQQAYTTA